MPIYGIGVYGVSLRLERCGPDNGATLRVVAEAVTMLGRASLETWTGKMLRQIMDFIALASCLMVAHVAAFIRNYIRAHC